MPLECLPKKPSPVKEKIDRVCPALRADTRPSQSHPVQRPQGERARRAEGAGAAAPLGVWGQDAAVWFPRAPSERTICFLGEKSRSHFENAAPSLGPDIFTVACRSVNRVHTSAQSLGPPHACGPQVPFTSFPVCLAGREPRRGRPDSARPAVCCATSSPGRLGGEGSSGFYSWCFWFRKKREREKHFFQKYLGHVK